MYESLQDKGISTYADSIEVYYQRALRFNQDNNEALTGLSFHYATSDNLEKRMKALELAKELVKVEKSSRSYYVLAAAYYSLDDEINEVIAIKKAEELEEH